jgi:hypothetical protein
VLAQDPSLLPLLLMLLMLHCCTGGQQCCRQQKLWCLLPQLLCPN